MRASFGRFVFDSDTRQLFRGDDSVPISPKAFDLLDLLLRERPRAVSKEEIHERLWPKTFVSDASLSNLAAELRALFDDDAKNPRFVRTVRRFGYAFIGDALVTPAAAGAGPRQRLVWESREIALPPGETIFGRDDEARVWIDDASVSRRHACIEVRDGVATLKDLGSKNGTILNGELLASRVRLSDGDRIEVGRACLVFRESSPTRSTQTARGTRAPAGSPRTRRPR
jgi:DNA-binding winged helix-turn-helix (wHTH) protein